LVACSSVKIGIVTTSYPRFPGDRAGLFTNQLVESLKAQGHRVLVVTPEADGAQAQADVFLARFGSRLSRKIAYGAGIVENLKKNPLLLLGVPGFVRGIARAVSEHLAGCEVIDASFTAAGAAVARARRPQQAIVYTGHGTDIHLLDRSFWYRRYFRGLLARYDAVTVVSSTLAHKLRAHGCREEAAVIPNGVDSGAFDSASEWRDDLCWPVIVVFEGDVNIVQMYKDLITFCLVFPHIVGRRSPILAQCAGVPQVAHTQCCQDK